MKTLKQYWQKRWVKNLVFFLLLCVIFFTDIPLWLNVQVRSLTLGKPEVVEEARPADAQVFRSDAGLLDARGERVLLSEFRGRPMFVNFWASWCVPCRAEFPSLMKLREAWGEEVSFLFITSEGQEAFEQFLDEEGFSRDFYRQTSRLPTPLQHELIPATYLVNAEGLVVYSKLGAADWSDPGTLERLKQLLHESQ